MRLGELSSECPNTPWDNDGTAYHIPISRPALGGPPVAVCSRCGKKIMLMTPEISDLGWYHTVRVIIEEWA